MNHDGVLDRYEYDRAHSMSSSRSKSSSPHAKQVQDRNGMFIESPSESIATSTESQSFDGFGDIRQIGNGKASVSSGLKVIIAT